MPPERIDSLDADSLKGLVLSLLAKIDQLSDQNKKLIEQIGTLLARIAELEGRQAKPPKTPTNSSLPPSRGQKANVADGSTTKTRKGRPGVARELCPNPEATRDIYAERCACGARMLPIGQTLAHAYDHIELPPTKPVTTRINLHRADCRRCGKTVTTAPPADMPPGSPFGPSIVALVAYLHGCQMVSYARLAEMLDGLFGLKISEGAIANMLQRAAKPFADAADEIAAEVRLSEVIASDETSARVKGKTWWQWTFGCGTAVHHLIAPTRGKSVPTAFLAGAKPKMWLSDRLPAQLRHAEEHQFCLAHLIRNAQYAIDHGDTIFAPDFKALLKDACAVGAAGPISPTPPLPRIAAVSKGSWSACSHASRPMPRSAATGTSDPPACSDWAGEAPSPEHRRNRLLTVRRFALAMHAENARHQVPETEALGRATTKRRPPYIYAPDGIARLLRAAAALEPAGSIRPLMYATLLGLIAATGMRIAEALALHLDDVTADGLVIRETKFHKSRLLPLHETVRQALDRYLPPRRDVLGGSTLFVSGSGRPLPYNSVRYVFLTLLDRAGLRGAHAGRDPRIHDLRHTFAVRSLEQCSHDRTSVTRHVVALSTSAMRT